jgi:membrane-associated protease RseP (regulator of RpoE activity)
MRIALCFYLSAAIGVLSGLSPSALLGQSALEELERRIDEELPPPPEESEPGYLGLTGDSSAEGGVDVLAVRADGPAYQFGLRGGDRITAVNDVAVPDGDAMAEILAKLPVGSEVTFTVVRDGAEERVTVTLGRRPGDEDVPDLGEADERGPLLGVRLIPVNAESRARFRVAVDRGAVINGIRVGSPADRYGLPLGGVIVSIDRERVNAPEEAIAIVSSHRAGDEIEIGYYDGVNFYRNTVRLAPSGDAPLRIAPVEPVLPYDTRPAPGIFGEDRPVLRRLEQAITGVVEPPPPPRTGGIPAVVDAREREIVELRRQNDELNAQVEELSRRVQQLEEQLKSDSGESKLPAPTPPTNDDPDLDLNPLP